MDADQREKLYREAMGEDALERQKALHVERLACCGADKQAGHAPGCRHFDKPGSRQAGRHWR